MMEWEQSKENIQPLKKGRSVKGLGGCHDKLTIDQSEKDYFQKLEHARSEALQSVLDVYIEFYSWIRRNSSNTEKGKLLLENCVKEIGNKEEIKNDPRLVKLWLEYADMIQDPMEIFNFMNSNSIGSKVALFWIAWAFYYEKSGNFKAADRVFLNGIRQLAQPKDLLNRRYHQFQRRMTRHFLNDDTHGEEKIEEPRKFGSLSGNTALSSSNKNSVNLGFSIFSDDLGPEKNDLPVSTGSNVPNFWNTMGTEQERKKENEMLKTKWSQQALPLPAKNPNQSNPSTSLAIPFTIFSDEDNTGTGQSLQPDRIPSTQSSAPGLRSSSLVRENVNIQNENSRVDQRKEWKQPTITSTNNTSSTTTTTTAVKSTALFMKDEDETINTKLALADLEDMFACTEFDDQNLMIDLPRRRNLFCEGHHSPLPLRSSEEESSKEEEDIIEWSIFIDDVPIGSVKPSSAIITSSSTASTRAHGKVPLREIALRSELFDRVIEGGLKNSSFLEKLRRYFPVYRYSSSLPTVASLMKRSKLLLYQNHKKGEGRMTQSTFEVVDRIGKGSYGQALLLRSLDVENESQETVIKIGFQTYSIYWECFIHCLLRLRVIHQQWKLSSYYPRYFLPPLSIHQFTDQCFIQLEYGDGGTLIEAIKPLHTSFNSSDHEYLVAYLTAEMLAAVYCLMEAGIIHGDIKTDNWVLRSTEDDNSVQLRLIDFGRARIHRLSRHSASQWKEIDDNKKVNALELLQSMMREEEEEEPETKEEVEVFYSQGKFAKGFQQKDLEESQIWSFEHDLYGLAACVHHLLFFQDLQVKKQSVSQLEKRCNCEGRLALPLSDETEVTVPINSMRRYWNQKLWSRLFLVLLNPHLMGQQQSSKSRFSLDCNLLLPLMGEFRSFLDQYRNGQEARRTLLRELQRQKGVGRK